MKGRLLDPKRAGMERLRKSREQERATARSVGGRTVVASGARWHSKGDVTSDGILVECKRTDAQSYSLKLAELKKHVLRALMAGKKPLWQIEFGDDKFAVMLWDDFESMKS